jgi:hypothetical protein
MKRLIFLLMITVLLFSSSSCLFRNEVNRNEVKDYAESQNLPPEIVEILAPLGEAGMSKSEKALIDAISILPQEVKVGEVVLNLLKRIPLDTTVVVEELIRFEDLDQDGLNNQNELRQGTDLLDQDSDWDGLDDGEEVYTYMTDPLNKDSDYDTLDDGKEAEIWTNPLKEDSDGDGFLDGEEFYILGSNSLNENDPFAFVKDEEDSDGDGIKDCDDLEPQKRNPYKETVSWLSQEMIEDALSCINEADKVATFRILCHKVWENVPHSWTERGKNSYSNAKIWQWGEELGLRDISMNYYSYHQKVQRAPVCHDIACVYDIMADYIIAQTGWDEEGEAQGNSGVDCDVFLCEIDGEGHAVCIVNINGVEYVADPSPDDFFRLGHNYRYRFCWELHQVSTDAASLVAILMVKFDKRYTDTIYNVGTILLLGTPQLDQDSFWRFMRNQTPENEKKLRELYEQVKPVY